MLEQFIVALDDARHIRDKAVISKVAVPALLDKVIGVGDITKVSDEFISTGRGMSEVNGLVEKLGALLILDETLNRVEVVGTERVR